MILKILACLHMDNLTVRRVVYKKPPTCENYKTLSNGNYLMPSGMERAY